MDLESLRARAGISYVGKYRSPKPEAWERANRSLSQQVSEPAIDRGIAKRLTTLAAGLDVGRDNRSVTSPEWVAEGLSKYGCPIHPVKASVRRTNERGTDSITVSGIGFCSCRREDGNTPRDAAPSLRRSSRVQPQALRNLPGHSDEGMGTVLSGTPISGVGIHDGSKRRAIDEGISWAYGHAFRATLASAGESNGGRKPYPLDEVVDRFIHKRNYSGAPYFTRNANVLDEGLRDARAIWEGRRRFDFYTYGRRVQPGLTGPKTRLVWMAPLSTSIVGSAFSKRVYQTLERKRPFAFGTRQIEKGALVAEFQSRRRYVYQLDISGFDASVPAFMLDDVFRVLRTHLDLDAQERDVWERYVNDFVHSRLITPDGSIFQKHKGVPSGSAFTTLVGSVANLLLINYVWIRATGAAPDPDLVLIQGDDSIIASNTRLDLGEVAKYAAELGFTISAQKSAITDNEKDAESAIDGTVHFCGHHYYKGWPHRSKKEILQRMIFPERHRDRTDSESVLRMLAYLTDAWEAWEIFVSVYRSNESYGHLTRCLDELNLSDGIDLVAVDLPGQLRLQAIERESKERALPVKGLELTALPLIF